jgi:hypothetical protein
MLSDQDRYRLIVRTRHFQESERESIVATIGEAHRLIADKFDRMIVRSSRIWQHCF